MGLAWAGPDPGRTRCGAAMTNSLIWGHPMIPRKMSLSLVFLASLVWAEQSHGQATGPSGSRSAVVAPKVAVDPSLRAWAWVALKPATGPATAGSAPAAPFPAIHQVEEIDPEHGRLRLGGAHGGWVEAGRAYSTLETLRGFAALIRDHPGDLGLVYARGLVEFGVGWDAEASADFTVVLKHDPHNAEAYFHRGVANERSSETDRAFGDLFEAIRLDPNRAAYYKARARVASRMGAHHRAVEDDTTALRFEPGDREGHFHRASSALVLHRYALAQSDYEIVLGEDPEDEAATRGRALALAGRKRYEEALKLIDGLRAKINFNPAAASDPNAPDFAANEAKRERAAAATLISAQISRMEGNALRARREYMRVEALKPGNPEVKAYLNQTQPETILAQVAPWFKGLLSWDVQNPQAETAPTQVAPAETPMPPPSSEGAPVPRAAGEPAEPEPKP